MSSTLQEIFGFDLQGELQINGDPGQAGQIVQSMGPGQAPVWATVNGATIDKLVNASYDGNTHILTLTNADGSQVTVQVSNSPEPEPDEIVNLVISQDGLVTLTKQNGQSLSAQIEFPSVSSGPMSYLYNSVDAGVGASMVHTVQHDLDAAYPMVTVYRLDGPSPNAVVQPSQIVQADRNTLVIKFPVAIACACTVIG